MSCLKIVIVGAGGQLGSELCKILKQGECELGSLNLKNCEVYEFKKADLDISNLAAVVKIIEGVKPFCVVNCAAFTKVDLCETQKVDAFKVNGLGARNLAIACNKVGAKLVQVSTDYVFDGKATKPYLESDALNPQSVYGKSKAFGEFYTRAFCKRWFVVRTSWLYGLVGKNFVKTIAKLAATKGKVRVVADQFGSPTNVVDLAFSICKLIETDEFGIYHGSGGGVCSWHEFALEIVKCFKIDAKVEPCLTSEFVLPAKRPKFSVLQNFMFEMTIGDYFRHWKDALKSYCLHIDLNEIVK